MDAKRRALGIVGLIGALTLGGGHRACANPMRVARVAPARVAAAPALSTRAIALAALDRRTVAYYERALSQRWTTGGRQPGMWRFLVADSSGRLGDNAVVSYIQWRRSLNPIRFAQFHPLMVRALDRDRVARTLPVVPTVPVIPTVPTLPPVVIPPTTIPVPQVPAVPEPGTLVIGMLMAAAGVIAHRRRMKRPG